MYIIETVFQKHRDKTILGALIVASLALLILPQPAKLDVARRALDALLLPVERYANFVSDHFSLKEENTRLRRLVASMSLERGRLLEFRRERERLRRLAAFKEEQFHTLVAAEVVGHNFDRFQSVLVIDKGATDSLRVRMPVFTYQGLAGRLVKVFPNSSWVQLLRSTNQPVSCINKRSRVVGILEWRRRNVFALTSVSAVEDVAVGDTLLTSGFGGVVPKGFPVAIVTKVTQASDGLSLRVDARSPVDFLALEEVFVMTDEIPWDQGIFYDEADTALMRAILREAP